MKDVIRDIIESIGKDLIFDAHTIIECLIQKDSDSYLKHYNGSTTENYHSIIGKEIASFEGQLITRIGKSWSKNIRDNFTDCTCWKRN
jgi:hypothetical protein